MLACLLAASAAACGPAQPACTDVGAHEEEVSAPDRRLLGAAAAYPADPTLEARFEELASSQRARRAAAWEAVARVLAPVPLSEPVPLGDASVRVWTLQGPKAAVMLQQYGDDLDAKSLREVLAENLVGAAGAGAEKPKTVRLTMPGGRLDGVQLNYTTPAKEKSPATVTVQNLFTFASAEGVFALVVQDVRPEGEAESAEYQETLKLLGESLKTGDGATAAEEGAPAESEEAE